MEAFEDVMRRGGGAALREIGRCFMNHDLGDVQELIRALALPVEFADQLHPYVRDKYREMWKAVTESPA